MNFLARLQKAIIRRYILLAVVCSTLGILFFLFMHYGTMGELPTWRHQGEPLMLAAFSTTLFGAIVINLDNMLDKAIHWKSNFLLRFISGLGANIALVMIYFTLAGKFWFNIGTEDILKLNILFIIAVFIYEIFYGLFYSYRYYAVTQAELLQSERWQLELQFESLKSQISPHYLFNCLNTVSALLYKDSRIAEEFVRRMADTFRYVLGNQKHKLVTLREELEFVKAYYFLLQVRYEYHLKLEINIPTNILNSRIPPMTLQLLVENAVKHNAISKELPLLVYIGARDNTRLIVYNTKTQTVKPATSFRVGLENIHKRYSFFTKEKVIVQDADKFQVQLPGASQQHGRMKRLFIHSPFFRILTPPVYGVLVYLIILLVNNNVTQITTLISNQEVYVSMALSLIAFESMRIAMVIFERTDMIARRKIMLQWLVTSAVSIVMVLLAITQYYKWVIGFDISIREMSLFGGIFLVTAILYNALYQGNRYLHHENTQLIEQEQKLKENLEAEFSSFRQEINPNLLYESLEELILCMHTHAETAEELIDSLAALYRYQLVNRQREFVLLSEELQAVRHFMKLANTKHRQQIKWTDTVTESQNIQIMQGSLLTTLDTIVRNSLISEKSPLVFSLFQEDEDYIVLTHGLNDKLQLHPESLMAFQQLQRSYSIYSDRPFVQVKAGRENYIKFPHLTINQSAAVIA